MKKRTLAWAAIGVAVTCLITCVLALAQTGGAGDAPDYSQKKCWLQVPDITKDVDTFYIYSTAYIESSFREGAPDYAPLGNLEMIAGALGEYVTNASVFEDSTNVFVPFYRQAGLRFAGETAKKTGDIDAALSGLPYEDISAALDYFFENYNNGRTFIIAGHSQGSSMVELVLKNYFKEHPEYYKRMVAAYPIGFSVTKEYLQANPHLKFATGECDTGVIVSWNTEGPKNVEENAHNAVVLPNAVSINPLNWKRDDTYAPASENLGSLVLNEKTVEYEIGEIGADAQLVLDRGVVLTHADSAPIELTDFFGPESFHNDDYTFYYNNIKDNVAKRIAAFKAGAAFKSIAPEAPDYSKAACWYQIPGITKEVDTFFIYPTEYIAAGENDPDYAPLDNPEMLEGVRFNHMALASVFEEATNLFIPYYRQAGMRYAGEVWKRDGDPSAAFAAVPCDDITAALDYYFEHYNNGRPFIIAGHSQGSGIASVVLANYFREHPEYLRRMVAAYVIGFSITKDYLRANPHLKFAAGESDTGVIVSWNTEGPKNVEENAPNAVVLPNAVSINPLNWKRDDTYAPAGENLGSLVLNEETGRFEIGDLGADAQVVPGRGVVLTHADSEPAQEAGFFGPQSFHTYDYTFYYNNIKQNVAKRVAAFKAQ
ncbi:MAG: DUF3089 domain-containing protein [Thermoguttaceae bacterium]|nr:DUF3089 domain-containing protein [Thermoguttaceae bacterium]